MGVLSKTSDVKHNNIVYQPTFGVPASYFCYTIQIIFDEIKRTLVDRPKHYKDLLVVCNVLFGKMNHLKSKDLITPSLMTQYFKFCEFENTKREEMLVDLYMCSVVV